MLVIEGARRRRGPRRRRHGHAAAQDLVVARLSPDVVLIAIVWVVGLMLTQRAGPSCRGPTAARRPTASRSRAATRRRPGRAEATRRGVSTTRVVLVFGAAAAGHPRRRRARRGERRAAADQVGLSGVLFGATVLAAATSLPESQHRATAVRQGDYKLAFGDIFGGNAFLPVLFLLAASSPARRSCPTRTPPTSTSPASPLC